MILNVLLLILGFLILIKGADWFVDGASSVALNFHVSKMLVGLTIVAFGSSAPEFAVSVKSILSGSGDIVLGNVIGSNIINIMLILGLSSLIHPLKVKGQTVRKELPITLLITTLFVVLICDNIFDSHIANSFTRSDGIVLVLFFLVFIYYLFTMLRKKVDEHEEASMSVSKSILLIVIGVVLIILGSNFVVDGSTIIAHKIGISQRLISLTIVAFGTSLPELVTSVTASIKGEYDIAIGNIVGSCIFNIGVVLGLPVMLFGGIGIINFNYLDLLVMLLAVVLLFLYSFVDQRLRRSEGLSLLVLFFFYYIYIIFW